MQSLRELTIERLQELHSVKNRIAFAYSVCCRMLSNYSPFFIANKWGDIAVLNEALSRIEKFLLTGVLYDNNSLLADIMKGIPGSEEFPAEDATYAEMSASVIYYTLDNLTKDSVDELAWVFVVSVDTIEFYLQSDSILANPRRQDLEKEIMQRELMKQEKDFRLLLNVPGITDSILVELRNFNSGKSNIDISFA